MKFSIVRWMLPAVLLVCALLSLQSCKDNDALAGIEADGYVCRVTFDLCGGRANESEQQVYLARKDSLLIELGKNNTTAPVRSGYRVKEYYVKEEQNGAVVERTWNFDTDRVTGDITLYCRWMKDYTIQVLYGENNAQSSEIVIANESGVLESLSSPKWTGHTFVAFYYDAAYTSPVSFPYQHAQNDEQPMETLYAKFLEGNYRIVRKASDLKTISAGAKYYLLNDIDMEGQKVSLPDTFSGEIIGNGYTIRNLSVTKSQSKMGEAFGMFNRLADQAKILDVTFEDLTVTVKLDNEQNNMLIYLGTLAGTCDDGATLENVTISGKLIYDCCGRDLEGKISAKEQVFGEASDEKKNAVTANVTIEMVP